MTLALTRCMQRQPATMSDSTADLGLHFTNNYLISLAGKPLVCFTFQNVTMEELGGEHGGAGWLW